MPYRVVQYQDTPNPNALKCVLDKGTGVDKPRGYTTAPQASADPLGAALMAVAGVSNILIHDGWISIGKIAKADWKSVKAGVEKVLGNAP